VGSYKEQEMSKQRCRGSMVLLIGGTNHACMTGSKLYLPASGVNGHDFGIFCKLFVYSDGGCVFDKAGPRRNSELKKRYNILF
jgi:hypothetical protein